MKYAVTGSTGHFGKYAISYLQKLIQPQDSIVALARNVEKAKKTFGENVEARPGTYEDPDQLTESLKGVDRLLFISSLPGAVMPRIDQHNNVVQAAKAAGVKFIAYTSFPHADTTEAPLAADHKATEALLKKSGIAHAFLRNNWYLENEMNFVEEANNGEPFVYSAGDGKVGWAPEELYAQAAVTVLTTDQPKEVYEFAGPMHSYDDLAKVLQKVTGKDFEIASVSDDEFMANLRKYVPDKVDAAMTMIQKLIRNHDLEEETTDLADVLRKPVPSLEKQVRGLFKEPAK